MITHPHCDYCGDPFKPRRKDQRFCTTPGKHCRQKWQAEHGDLPGTVKSVRRLRSGTYSIVIHEPHPPAGIVPGARVRVETTHQKRREA